MNNRQMEQSDMKVDAVFIAHNRLHYTRRALESVLAEDNENLRITLWDNGSTDGTAEYLRSKLNHPRVKEGIFRTTNAGQIAAVNEVWRRSDADLLGKLDNDCIVPAGWSHMLATAHEDIEMLGSVACWPFFSEDFVLEKAGKKVQRHGPHRLLRHPWTCGTGFLVKRRLYEEFGPVAGTGMTGFFLDLALKGYINGFYYPLLIQEHMDDPKSEYCAVKTKEGFDAAVGVTAGLQSGKVKNVEALWQWREKIIQNLLSGTCNPRAYTGWWARLRQIQTWARGIGERVSAGRGG